MIISESNKFIFIHNPKCAGTTVRNSLEKFDTRDGYYWLFDEVDDRKIDKAHLALNILHRYAPQDFELLKKYFVFGFVRNPYDRVISAFNEGHPKVYKALKSNQIEISEYKEKLNTFCLSLTDRNTQGWHIKYRHCLQQNKMFYLEGKCYADVIIKLEDLNQLSSKIISFLPELTEIIKLWSQQEKSKNVKKLDVDLTDILSEESIKNISQVYALDFILFDYRRTD